MRYTIKDIQNSKDSGEKIPTVTAYDYTSAKIVDQSGIQMILVGDSLGQVVLGYDSTVPVTMAEMLHHTKAVVRGSSKALIVVDMPFMSYQINIEKAMENGGRFLKEGGAQAIKLEGGEEIAETVWKLTQIGIPIMAHIGLTPQSVNQLGGYKIQGKTMKAAVQLIKDAKALQEAGAFSMVLESVPTLLSKLITERVTIPTIGIGAGPFCDGQIQVFHDIFGFFSDFIPKHTRRYVNVADSIKAGLSDYINDVKTGIFPSDIESHKMNEDIIKELEATQGNHFTAPKSI